jgi:hypothetical protein
MVLKLWRFATIVLSALLVTLCFTHLWQLQARMGYDATLWLRTLDMHDAFRPTGAGPFVEVGALFTAGVLAFMTRRRYPAFGLTLFAVVVLASSMALWWLLVLPAHDAVMTWTLDAIPADWAVIRTRWEYAHAARAILAFLAFGALVWSIILETPAEEEELEEGYWDAASRDRPLRDAINEE